MCTPLVSAGAGASGAAVPAAAAGAAEGAGKKQKQGLLARRMKLLKNEARAAAGGVARTGEDTKMQQKPSRQNAAVHRLTTRMDLWRLAKAKVENFMHIDLGSLGKSSYARMMQKSTHTHDDNEIDEQLRKATPAVLPRASYNIQEARTTAFCPSQEKFDTVVLRGVRNISEAP